MQMALQWVQSYISLFGGDRRRVTIGGESAGGGAVMCLALAYGGELKDSLFTSVRAFVLCIPIVSKLTLNDQIIAASPFLPKQYGFADPVRTHDYQTVANLSGCANVVSQTTFDCLLEQNTSTIVQAGLNVVEYVDGFTWGFTPVTDGVILQQTPSQQLMSKKVNGNRILSGVCLNPKICFRLRVQSGLCHRIMPTREPNSHPRI
jgi:carboxylesterase type B